jgi:DNA polymerase III subunit epsilon
MNLKLERNLVFFDLETTGLEISHDRIIEINMVKVKPDGTEETYYSRVNPDGVEISQGAFEKHGIKVENLKEQPTMQVIAKEVYDFIVDCDLGGYNLVKFDIPMLVNELLRCGVYWNPRGVNVLDSYLIYTKQEPRNLTGAYKYYTRNELENAHSAAVDIKATMEILEKQIEKYDLPKSTKAIHDLTRDERENVDLAGKLKKDKDGKVIFTFGKHNGKSVVEVYKNDSSYFSWIIDKSDMPMETKYVFKKLLEMLKK